VACARDEPPSGDVADPNFDRLAEASMIRDHVEQLAAAGGSAPANQEQAAIPPTSSVAANRLAARASMIEELSDDEVDEILDNLSPQPTPTH
jgi:hypothetical protein